MYMHISTVFSCWVTFMYMHMHLRIWAYNDIRTPYHIATRLFRERSKFLQIQSAWFMLYMYCVHWCIDVYPQFWFFALFGYIRTYHVCVDPLEILLDLSLPACTDTNVYVYILKCQKCQCMGSDLVSAQTWNCDTAVYDWTCHVTQVTV